MIVFAKKELFEINALLTWFFRCCGAVCVRGTKDEMAAIEQTVEKVQKRRNTAHLPGGHPRKGRKLLPPKSGLFVIAAGAGVDVVPCRILYDTPDGKMHLFCKVRVIYGEPMPAEQFAMESRRDTKSCVPTSRPCWMRGKRWGRKRWRSELPKRRGSALVSSGRWTDLWPAGTKAARWPPSAR